MELFESGITAPDQIYNNIRDGHHPKEVSAKQLAISLWHRYQPYADSNFLEDIKIDFDSRFWEMDLTCCLMDYGFTVESENHGPDIKITNRIHPIWIEAIAPGNGLEGLPDSVPQMNRATMASPVPDDQIILRLTGAIDEKHKKYKKYIEDSIVSDADPYVIAINVGKISGARSDFEPPRIIRSVFPIGNEYVEFDPRTSEHFGGGFQYKPSVSKANGTNIPIDIFLDPQFEGISAVFCSSSDCCNRTEVNGANYIIVHNPMAKNPLPHGSIPIGTEYIPVLVNEEQYQLTKVVHL